MDNIGLIRIDDRLVHGQVVTKWVQETKCNTIVIVDNYLVTNSYLSNIFKMAAPRGIEVEVKSAEQFAKEWINNEFDSKRLLILYKSVKVLKESFDNGFKFDKVQIGGIGSEAGRKLVYHTVTLSQEDAEILKELNDQNVEIFFQCVPDDRVASLESILKKYFKKLV
jgi:PTS system mannose-specific IIB component/D-glucosaminate-specific PTS system IIB component